MTVCLCGGMTALKESALYQAEIEALAEALARRDETVLYGGVTTGLVGQFADAFAAKGGRLEGALIPEEEASRHPALRRVWHFETYDARQDFMFAQSREVLFLPGGLGTFHELFSLILKHKMQQASQRTEGHSETEFPLPFEQTLILLNWGGFWAPAKTLLGEACCQGFLKENEIKRVVLRPLYSFDTTA